MNDSATIERLSRICSNVGFDLQSVDPDVLGRLVLLSELSQTVTDLERMADLAFRLFLHYDANDPQESCGDLEQRTVVLGCMFSDIGKTGPKHADARGQRLIAEMFSIEGVKEIHQPVSQFLRTYFPADAQDRIARFEALGLSATLPMRQFWNLHTLWTLEIIDGSGVPPEAVAAAACHHLLDNVNPAAIVGADQRFTRQFGANTCFDRAEKLVIVLDKYDALRRRGRRSHKDAIAWLSDRLAKHERFHGDRELKTLIHDIDTVASDWDEFRARYSILPP